MHTKVAPQANIVIIGDLQHPARLFPAIATETRSHVETACAAYWMNRKPQTLRVWACLENGPLRPSRVNGRLAWAVSEIRMIMNGGAA